MGQVVDLLRRAYSGAVADMAAITPADGDSFYAIDTDQLFIGHGGSWVHQVRYVDRPVNAYDFTLVDFTNDGTWKVDGLDLSGICPVGTVAVSLKLHILDDAAGSAFNIRRDAGNSQSSLNAYTQVANISKLAFAPVSLDPVDRLLDYNGANLVFTNVDLAVLAYWV